MRRHLSSASLLVTLCAALVMTPSAEGNYIAHGKGQWVQAFFESIDSSGCIVTRVHFVISGNRSSKDSFAVSEVSIDQFDRCNGNQSLVSAYGFDLPSSNDLGLPNGSLASASIETSMTDVWDTVSQSILPVSIDLAWTATGPAIRSTETYRFRSPDERSIVSHTGIHRPATASGVVTYGTGNLTPEPTEDAVIGEARSRTVIIN
jgi:hypothetical protein